jgi:chemotaxis protein methyltransferase WspC
MSHAEIERLLAREIGMDVESVGSGTIAAGIGRRMIQLGAEDATQYLRMLRENPGELQELTEEVVVRNSWFFREPKAFDVIRDQASRTKPMRILCLGCAGGEEPFSIAMALFDSFASTRDLRIDAVDISRRGLALAAAGKYRKNAFSGDDLDYRTRFFEQRGEEYRLKPEILERVHFTHGNVLDPQTYPGEGVYDAVLCRNLLIYLTQEARQATIAAIKQAMAPTGVLLVGSVESGRIPREHFELIGAAGSAAFRKREAVAATRSVGESRTAPPDSEVAAADTAPTPQPRMPAPRRKRITERLSRSVAATPPAQVVEEPRHEEARCWLEIGTQGNGSCPELPRYINCFGCPVYWSHGRTLLDREPPPGYRETNTANIRSPKLDDKSTDLSVLVFRLWREWFALPTEQVVLVAPPGTVHTVPNRTSRIFKGIVNVVGALRLCVSFHDLFDLSPDRRASPRGKVRTRMVVFGSQESSWVFISDEVHGILHFDPATLGSAPKTKGSTVFNKGLLPWHERRVGLLDGELLLASLPRFIQ